VDVRKELIALKDLPGEGLGGSGRSWSDVVRLGTPKIGSKKMANMAPQNLLLVGFKHEFYVPFHIWDVILPIDELIFFKMVKTC
jgi:hypothetical protein